MNSIDQLIARCVFALTCGSLVATCVIPVKLLIHNNTKADVVVTVKERGGRIEAIEIPEKEEELVPFLVDAEYRIASGRNSWRYRIDALDTRPIGESRYRRKWATDIWVLKLQLNEGGQIYLLSEDQIAPTTSFSAQPNGFPLSPL